MPLQIVFIFITLVINAMGIGVILPVMPDLIQSVGGFDLSKAAAWGGVMATSFAVMQFLFSPLLGNLSDCFGRRPVLLFSQVFMALDYLLMALAWSMPVLLIARFIGGITAATPATASAFLADISPPEQKTARFGLAGAAFGLGFVLGPLIGGALGELDPRAPFFAAAGLSALNALFGYLVLQETVDDKIRRRFSLLRANPVGALLHVGRRHNMLGLLFIIFLYEFAFFVYPSTWAYFTKFRFGWSPTAIGLSLMAFGLSMALMQGGLIRVILRFLGSKWTVMLGLVVNIIAFVLLAVTTNGWVALALTPFAALGAIVDPALQGVMARRVTDDQQGELQGAITSMRSIAMALSPLVMTQTFTHFTKDGAPIVLPGAAFALAAILMTICACAFMWDPCRKTRENPPKDAVESHK